MRLMVLLLVPGRYTWCICPPSTREVYPGYTPREAIHPEVYPGYTPREAIHPEIHPGYTRHGRLHTLRYTMVIPTQGGYTP